MSAPSEAGRVVAGYIVPGRPHPLLTPDASPAYRSLRDSYERVRQDIASQDADLILIYSTGWPSVIGHQVQARKHPEWVHVDEEWHELGEIPYRFEMDPAFARDYVARAQARGLHARTVDYHGFPIDTGTIVALKLLNPDNRIPACVVSCNMYADRAETLVLGKAARDAIVGGGRKAIAIAVTALSNRLFTTDIDPAEDRISSLKDDEWNRKLLEFLGEGRLEDVAQLAREFTKQANADSKFKAIWWLAALMGQHNRYEGEVFDYQPIHGTGAALVKLVHSTEAASVKEFDEEDVEFYGGDRNVLAAKEAAAAAAAAAPAAVAPTGAPMAAPVAAGPLVNEPIESARAPRAVGAYPHARRVGHLIYVSGIGPRLPGSGEIPGGPVRDELGPLDYDIERQTRQVIENIKAILEDAGSSLDRVVDCTSFLIDMDRDFVGYNQVYKEYFESIQAARTTVEVTALPTPIAVEMKVVALAGDA